MINSFNASIDTNDLKLNDYGGDSSCTEQIDLINGERIQDPSNITTILIFSTSLNFTKQSKQITL